MRLNAAHAVGLPAEVTQPGYDRNAQAIGIVHFGIGAFHRAHQAWYTDLAMAAGERDWAISGVSLRSPAVAEQLNPQDGLYLLTARSGEASETRLIGAVREVLFASEAEGEVIERIAAPECRIVSFTVTEKGYARADAGNLDFSAAESSFYPYLTEALKLRMARGLSGVTLMSCDNLAGNGKILQRLLSEWISVTAPELGGWFAANCTVPSTMIDRIVPRSTAEGIAELEQHLGIADEAAVFTEQFSQWVIEDDFPSGRPTWENCGAQLVDDVLPYETAKLRMLNGAHSLLAYCGLRAGYEFVHEAVADPDLRRLAEQLMREEAALTIDAARDQDLAGYADELIARFANSALNHRLAQIAMDGSQKIPQRWLDTAMWHAERGSEIPAIRTAFDAWIWHLRVGSYVDDPLAERLIAAAKSGDEAIYDLCFGTSGDAAIWPEAASAAQLLGVAG